ncbi:MAG: hypothetical protein H6718_26850 [Polyangiaceae bacterium]|nr:hypothetical protein [Myxococcales bacterium]MCB9589061.1 hypothetical protein [Polyangiaceae bacterium]
MKISRLQLVGVGCAALYVLTAFRVGEAFPFARFHMFDHIQPRASRLVALPPDGRPHEVSEFANWACSPAPVHNDDCFSSYPESDARVFKELQSSPTVDSQKPAVAVAVARREISTPDPEGPAVIRYCPILSCTAQPR